MTQQTDRHILVVDDARDIREPLAQYLKRQGYRVSLAADAQEARTILNTARIHLVVLDIMMPGEDGLSLCRWVQNHDGPPVILLTAMADETDRIIGLEIGADDYVVKPFNPRELLARIRAVLRRVPGTDTSPGPALYQFGSWEYRPETAYLCQADQTPVPLTSAENRLLTALVSRPQQVLSRDQLLDLTQGREAKAFDRAIDNQISRLRRKIEADPKKPLLIITEWGGGYRFAAEVKPL